MQTHTVMPASKRSRAADKLQMTAACQLNVARPGQTGAPAPCPLTACRGRLRQGQPVEGAGGEGARPEETGRQNKQVRRVGGGAGERWRRRGRAGALAEPAAS